VARPIKGMAHPAWNIIVVMYQVLLWSCIKYSNIVVIIFCWFKNSCENKVVTCFFCQRVVHGTAGRMGTQAQRAKWAGTT
jgi:hypothetical protein